MAVVIHPVAGCRLATFRRASRQLSLAMVLLAAVHPVAAAMVRPAVQVAAVPVTVCQAVQVPARSRRQVVATVRPATVRLVALRLAALVVTEVHQAALAARLAGSHHHPAVVVVAERGRRWRR